jgi:hypothetical protein
MSPGKYDGSINTHPHFCCLLACMATKANIVKKKKRSRGCTPTAIAVDEHQQQPSLPVTVVIGTHNNKKRSSNERAEPESAAVEDDEAQQWVSVFTTTTTIQHEHQEHHHDDEDDSTFASALQQERRAPAPPSVGLIFEYGHDHFDRANRLQRERPARIVAVETALREAGLLARCSIYETREDILQLARSSEEQDSCQAVHAPGYLKRYVLLYVAARWYNVVCLLSFTFHSSHHHDATTAWTSCRGGAVRLLVPRICWIKKRPSMIPSF